ncbi:MAG: hypothetical protein GXP37_09350 [Chloroflexi bacterium]|nr:hypothetical protein [Chloroflexota bacterium]
MTRRRLTLALSFLLLLALVALPVAAQSFPDPGTGSTYTELVNTTADEATVNITYYTQGGGTVAGPGRVIAGNGSTAIDPASSQLPAGFNGAGVVSSNKKLASVVQTQWLGGPGDGFQMGLYSGVSAGSSKICLPSLFKFAPAIVSSFTVQNTGTGDANVELKYYSRTGTLEGTFTDTIPVGAQHTYDMRTPSATVPNVANGWDGSAVISVTNGQTIAGVGVVNQGGRSSTYNAADCAGLSGATTLVVPSQFRVFNSATPNDPATRGTWSWVLLSALNVLNLESSEANVTLVYTPRDPAKNSLTLSNQTIPANSAAGYNTRGGVNGANPETFDTLGNFWDGTVTITSDKAIVATVITQWFRGTGPESGYYVASNAANSQTKFWVPDIRRVKVSGNFTEFSAVIIQNIGNADTDVTTKFYDRNGNMVHSITSTIAPGPSIGYNTRAGTGGTAALGDSFEGHAVVESNGQPLAVVLNGVALNPYGSGTTNGISE